MPETDKKAKAAVEDDEKWDSDEYLDSDEDDEGTEEGEDGEEDGRYKSNSIFEFVMQF